MTTTYLKTYEINPLTMAVITEIGESGKWITRVIEESVEFYINDKPLHVIQQSCKYFGSSLKGRQEAAAAVTGSTYKLPVAIDTSIGLYFFPTHSPTNPKCCWLSHAHIEKLQPTASNKAEIILKNQKRIILDISYGSMKNQIQRTAQYRYLMETRINQMRTMGNIVAEHPPSAFPPSGPPFFG